MFLKSIRSVGTDQSSLEVLDSGRQRHLKSYNLGLYNGVVDVSWYGEKISEPHSDFWEEKFLNLRKKAEAFKCSVL